MTASDGARQRESVWGYPRPPALERTSRHLRVVFGGEVVADTRRGFRVLETSHPPNYYFPPEDVRTDLLHIAPGRSLCEWKGQAHYRSVRVGDATAERGVWLYPKPTDRFEPIAGSYAFYPHLMDVCSVDGEEVVPQPGGFYGGWITSDLEGPFKGGPGTMGW